MERPDPLTVGLARSAYRALARRDLDTYLELAHPDIEFDPFTPEGPYRGHAGVREWWCGLFSAIPDFATEVQRIEEFQGLLLARIRTRGHGARSDAPFEQTVWDVGEWRAGKLVSWHAYESPVEAREAAATLGD